jgi:hypothetical protein
MSGHELLSLLALGVVIIDAVMTRTFTLLHGAVALLAIAHLLDLFR